MNYSGIDTFYLTEHQLNNCPSRKDGIDETTLRIYGCELIHDGCKLLDLPVVVIAIGEVLFHRFYCKKSFAQFNVKIVAASCVWLASRVSEYPVQKAKILKVFDGMDYKRQNLPIRYLDESLKKFKYLMVELVKTERHILIVIGFVCHVEFPHKLMLAYLDALEAPRGIWQEAWNLANDSLRMTLCVRFKSHVVACGVVYAASRRFGFPLPVNPPWWEAFDAKKSEILEVCRVMARLYSLSKAKYIPVCKQETLFSAFNPPSHDLGSNDGSNLVSTTVIAKMPFSALIPKADKDEIIALEKSSRLKNSNPYMGKEEKYLKESDSHHRAENDGKRNKERDWKNIHMRKEEKYFRKSDFHCRKESSGRRNKERDWKGERMKERGRTNIA